MSILTILVVLVVAGVALYLINRFIPMDGKVKTILNWVVIGALVLWLLKGLGILSFLSNVHV
jgi:hypothetical protein